MRTPDGLARQQLLAVIHQLLGQPGIPLSAIERDRLAREVLDEVFGLGPLEPLLQDPTVSDILVNTYKTVYVERHGVLEETSVVFKDNVHLMHIIEKIVSGVGRRVDESSPMVDARLPDGSRVNVIVPPLAVDGPIVSIRRFGSTPLSGQDLVNKGAMTPEMLEVLQKAVQGAAEHRRLRWHRCRQDDSAERAVGVHLGTGADRNHRGFGRTAIEAEARGPAGVPSAQRRGQGSGASARAGDQRPAHAT